MYAGLRIFFCVSQFLRKFPSRAHIQVTLKDMVFHQFHSFNLVLLHFTQIADNEFGEKTVSILLDDEEASIVFIDHPFSEMSVSCIEYSAYDSAIMRQ